ncbi:hypothetical protein HOL21_04790 [Candidatus Woesearchaeota archaeon]|jgi:hypothetical protein|nr:hypothetical protein [Candidatus Woesearchaeota archaeon]MBT5397503.1 hypothetical protein [Candidatus Woesearchaeota archaeon]MBT5924128.1 hypothetical protein [Candidatus Woesearchaeota archaeon]MBT6367924.1 hypothetical protein [Candidatus Woesearchaeota archaeon]MBT7763148.1 hypothetical protein [Candidatus Woesearchaeota archaeon]
MREILEKKSKQNGLQEKMLIKVALAITLLGLTFLFFYADEFTIEIADRIDTIPAEEKVRIAGEVTRVSTHENVIFLEVEGKRTETMDIIVFNDEDLYVKKGHYVDIVGVVEDYKGKKEVIAERVEVK